jgi:hypothetical protein
MRNINSEGKFKGVEDEIFQPIELEVTPKKEQEKKLNAKVNKHLECCYKCHQPNGHKIGCDTIKARIPMRSQTAIEWLEEQLNNSQWENVEQIIEQAKEIENQQQDYFAIGFAEWLNFNFKLDFSNKAFEQLLEIFKTNKTMENTNLKNEQVKNILLEPLNHPIENVLKAIQFGRPAETQLQIQKLINEFKNK